MAYHSSKLTLPVSAGDFEAGGVEEGLSEGAGVALFMGSEAAGSLAAGLEADSVVAGVSVAAGVPHVSPVGAGGSEVAGVPQVSPEGAGGSLGVDDS